MTAPRLGYLAEYITKHRADYDQAGTVELPTGRAVIAVPVGAIVTDQLHTFAVEPLDVAAMPVRVRCSACPWQATTTGLDSATAEATRHALAHLHHAGGAL